MIPSFAAALPRAIRAPLVPLAVWLLSFSVFTVASVDHLLGAVSPPALQLSAKIGAYVTAATTAALGVGVTIAFAVGCGVALRWLEGAVDPRAVSRSVCRGVWVFAAYTSTVATAWFARPRQPLTRDDLVAMASGEPDVEATLGMAWMTELQYAAGAAFLLVVFLLLGRFADRTNAGIAVAFGTSCVVMLVTALRALAALLPA